MRRFAPLVAVLSVLMVLSLVFGDRAVAEPKKDPKSSKVGQACHVVAGGNNGKSGTYTNDTDGLNCAGNWGSTGCTSSDGKDNGNCKDGKREVGGGGGNHDLLETILANQQRLLADQQTVIKKLGDLGIRIDNLQIKLGDVEAACLPPDLVPVAQPGSVPPNFCQTDGNGNLLVRVMNQGRTDAPASTARVTFSTPAGPVSFDVSTPPLTGNGGFADLTPIPIPAECFLPANPFPNACSFTIAVDIAGVVAENDETNNVVSGACVPVL